MLIGFIGIYPKIVFKYKEIFGYPKLSELPWLK